MASALDDPDYTPPPDARALTGIAREAELARQTEAARDAQRYVPASEPVAPMYPTDPTGQPLQGPNQPNAPSLTMQQYAPGSDDTSTTPETRAILAERPESNPFYSRGSGNPEMRPANPDVPPSQPPTPVSAGTGAAGGSPEGDQPPAGRDAGVPSEGAVQTGGIVTAPLPGRKPEPPATAVPPSAIAAAEKPAKAVPSTTVNRHDTTGARGYPTTISDDPSTLPPANKRLDISPQAYVDLEKTNPTLYDQITIAARSQDISPWMLTNVMYAANDPSAKGGGRMGLTGITQDDVDYYKRAYPQLFVDQQTGAPIDPATDPHLNLLLGAMKLRNTNDLHGQATQGALEAYFGSSQRVDTVARGQHPPEIRGGAPQLAAIATNPANPPPVDTKTMPNGTGTATPAGIFRAAEQARQDGDARTFATYAANTAERGMSSTDIWRNLETKAVANFLRNGDFHGAQQARDLIFQQSHIGAAQSLMRADAQLRGQDYNGAARSLAEAYWFTPDGGQAKFHVMPDGVYGQRYNEATGQPVGSPFLVTPQTLAPLLNIAQDPVAYSKNLREEQKAQSEIAMQYAHAQYYGQQPAIAAMKDQSANQRAANARAAAIAINANTQAQSNARAQARGQTEYDTRYDIEQLRQQGKLPQGGVPNDAEIEKEITNAPLTTGGAPLDPTTSAYYRALRRTGNNAGPVAMDIARKLSNGDLRLWAMTDNTWRVVPNGSKDPNQSLATIPFAALQGIGAAPTGAAPTLAGTPPAAAPTPARPAVAPQRPAQPPQPPQPPPGAGL